jgi:2-hydroxychromene-2-carboxylate isomerase
MTLSYDLFRSFRSPYSYLVTPRLYLVTPRLRELEREFDVKAAVRPVYPIAVLIGVDYAPRGYIRCAPVDSPDCGGNRCNARDFTIVP